MEINSELLLSKGGQVKKISKGELIFQEGNEARCYHHILQGEVRIFNTNQDGREFTQGIFTDGCSFGEPPLLISQPYPSSAIAVKETKLIKVPADQFFTLLDMHPDFQRMLLNDLALRIYNKTQITKDVVNNPPEIRILGFLNSIIPKECKDKGRSLVAYTRQEIANHTGLRVETVIRTLMKMKIQNKVDIINHKLYY